MKILVFGKDGQLGRAFQHKFEDSQASGKDVIYIVGRADCDLSNAGELMELLQSFNPKVIINAAAYTAVENAETEPYIAYAINKTAPELMAQYAAQHNATFLHFSTDYVFDGSKLGKYTELDKTYPLSIYGKSKEAGELAIANMFADHKNGQYAILRTSWLYGDGHNFIRNILALAKKQTEIQVIDDQYGVPTCSAWLAAISYSFLIDELGGVRDFLSGIYNAVPKGEVSRHVLAQYAVKIGIDFGMQLLATPASIRAISSSAYSAATLRPLNSRLETKKLQLELERLGVLSKLPQWNEAWDKQVSRYVKLLI